jgi:hypothetical protein
VFLQFLEEKSQGAAQMGVRFHYLASIPVILRSGALNKQWPEPDA